MAKEREDGQEAVENQVPEAEEKKNKAGKGNQIRNEKVRNESIYAVSGKPIYFNEQGVATVENASDYDYLGTVPGYRKI